MTADEEGERILHQLAKKMADEAMAILCGSGAFKSPRPTALRLTPGGALEVVEIDDAGEIIEPPRPCPKCGPVLLCSEHMPWT
jgi:hypothetical protein